MKKAQGEAQSLKLQAGAESERIKLIANAEAYQLAVSAMGESNFTQLKITESIGKESIKVMPDILITGGSND